MYSLISFATQWGSKHGGINSFNTDFLTAFGVAYHLSVQVICIVASATQEEIEDARNAHVILLPLPYPPRDQLLTSAQAQVTIDELKGRSISFNHAHTVWLGHDRITGGAANAAAKIAGGRSALIHHMSYDHYESYAENSQSAYDKTGEQVELFQQADLVLAVGPLLRDALSDRLHGSKPVHMLIPGLADIETHDPPRTFTAFLSGRFSNATARVKQDYLGVAAFATAQREASQETMPESLCKSPKLVLRGVDFEPHITQSLAHPQVAGPETELKKFAEQYAHGVINLHALPYTHDRQKLYAELSSSSVALMPSWHEGFGLVAWEAIAAGVPLIISKNSGVYRWLEEEFPGAGPGCVFVIQVAGTGEFPFFREEDLRRVIGELKKVANNIHKARQQAGILRNLLGKYSWPACAEEAAVIFEWPLQKGSMPTQIAPPLSAAHASATEPVTPTPGSPLHMPLKQWKQGGTFADSLLLRAEEALVPFDLGRQPELDALYTWLEDNRWPQAVRLLTGSGGLGKTRLALELCQQSLASKWHAGLLDTDLHDRDMTTSWQALLRVDKPLLIVIDYAETRHVTLLALIKAMVEAPSKHAVRLLLLARDGGEWWDNLPGKDKSCEPLLSSYATTGPFRLAALHESERDRRHAYQNALSAFAQAIGAPAPDVVPDLSGEHFGRPLYLQMAALLALHGERPITAQGLTKALLNHERRYWSGLFSGSTLVEPERHAEMLLALTTLAGGFTTPKQARPYWSEATGDLLDNLHFSLLFHTLAPLYPGKQGLQAVRPDLLGEALVAQALLRPEAAGLLDAMLANSASQLIRHHTLTVLARLSIQHYELHETLVEALVHHFAHCYQDIVAVATEAPSHLPVLAEAAFVRLQLATKSQIASLLVPQLSEESVQLAQFACLVTKYLLDKCNQKYLRKPGNNECMTDYADVAARHALSLMRVGRDAEALKYSKQALELYQRLIQKDKDRFEPAYAGALNNYANRLNELGQFDEALTYGKQALEFYQRLVQKHPDRHEPAYAGGLDNYAGHLSELGQYDEALKYDKQALELYQRLLLKDKDRFAPAFAGALNNYANRLNELGQFDEALTYGRQALDLYQRLVQENQDRHEPDYVGVLSNYANWLGELGQHDEALKYSKQALELRRRLVEKNPDRHEPDYGRVLNNHAIRLSELGQYDEALKYSGHALELRQRLMRKDKDRFEPAYAGTLQNYGNCLGDLGQYDEALAYDEEARELYQRLAQKHPARFAENLFIVEFAVHLLSWMSTNSSKEDGKREIVTVPATIRPHRRPVALLYKAFIQACWASEQFARADAFKQVITIWCDLPLTTKAAVQAQWLCAAAWCATFEPSAVEGLDWRVSWHQYANQRDGRLPRWVQEVAQRMLFEWPT